MVESKNGTKNAVPQFKVNPDVIAQRMGNEVVLIHLRTNRIYELNRTAARLWELIKAGYDRAQIQQQMLQEFDVDQEQLAQEIEALLSLLCAENLVSTHKED